MGIIVILARRNERGRRSGKGRRRGNVSALVVIDGMEMGMGVDMDMGVVVGTVILGLTSCSTRVSGVSRLMWKAWKDLWFSRGRSGWLGGCSTTPKQMLGMEVTADTEVAREVSMASKDGMVSNKLGNTISNGRTAGSSLMVRMVQSERLI